MIRLVLLINLLLVSEGIQANQPESDCNNVYMEDAPQAGKELIIWLNKASFNAEKVNDIESLECGFYISSKLPGELEGSYAGTFSRLNDHGFIIAKNDRIFYVIGKTRLATVYGVFQLLEQIGYRWFLPGKNWTIVPDQIDMTNIESMISQPDFINRGFFGSGGISGGRGLNLTVDDPKKDWSLWKKHNRFGYMIKMGGHRGDINFNIDHKEELLKHPEYMAERKGKRKPYSKTVKHCISNPGYRELYVDDKLKEYLNKKQKQNDRETITINVEPTDGPGHCTCSECKQMGGISYRTFFLANQVARAFKEKGYHDALITLYAYSEHAGPPNLEIEDNIRAQIIPYNWQKNYEADSFITEWSGRLGQFGVYDYWNMPNWKADRPSISVNSAAKRVKYWHSMGATGVNLETSYSKIPDGLQLYVAGKLLWDADQNVDIILNDFYTKAFGNAAPHVKNFYDSMYKYPTSISAMSHALRLAEKSTDNVKVLQRVNDLKLYVNYVYLLNKALYGPRGEEMTKARLNLYSYTWKLYPKSIVQSGRLNGNHFSKTALKKNPDAVTIKKMASNRQKTDSAFFRLPEPLHYEIANDLGKFDNVQISYSRKDPKVNSIDQRAITPIIKRLTTYLYSGNNNKLLMTLVADKPSKLSEANIYWNEVGTIKMNNLKMPKTGQGKYGVSLSVKPQTLYRIQFNASPNGLLSFSIPHVYTHKKVMSTQRYIFIPPTLDTLYYSSNPKKIRFYALTGNVLTPTKIRGNIYALPIPVENRGRHLQFKSTGRGFNLLNLPNIYYVNTSFHYPFEIINNHHIYN